MAYKDATVDEVNQALIQSNKAFNAYKKLDLKIRAAFLYAIADELKKSETELILNAQRETNLDEARLQIELKRTIFQLTSYGDACVKGTWLDIAIDTADEERIPPKPDVRKMLIPVGPVVVFGASNFPFAYSTAGGDTACALAAGCTVIIKAHPAHAQTSELVSKAVHKAAAYIGLPQNVFIHLHGTSFKVGQTLVHHPLTKAVAFTGSFDGGKALFDLANSRPVPIPVFAEMGSVNPVFLLPEKLRTETKSIAHNYIKSITQSAGQFCTNPGILVGIEDDALAQFKQLVGEGIRMTTPAKMLHAGIAKHFHNKRKAAIEAGANIIAANDSTIKQNEGIPTFAEVNAETFLNNPLFHKEVFGPYSLLVVCKERDQMKQVAEAIEGQLTCTLIGTEEELKDNLALVDILKEKCGRLVLNGVPTGVEVVLGMHHGGPFPATTDCRFTAVGADGIKRFARPLCFQNWSNDLLPPELKNENPLGLWRTVNNALTKDAIHFD